MMLKQFFDTSTGFRFSKMQCGSVPFIPVAVHASPYLGVEVGGSFYSLVGLGLDFCQMEFHQDVSISES